MLNVNELPEGWVLKELKEVCKAVTGTTPPKNDLENYGNDIPFVKPPQLFDQPIRDAPEKLSKKGADLARILPVNSVLVTCIGNLGRTAINFSPVAFNQQINALIPYSNLDGKFLFYQAQSPSFRNQLEHLSSATTVAIVNKGKFETIKVALPPLPTQHAIVTKIEEIFSELDHGVAQLKTARAQLKVYKQAVLKWAFEGRLTNEVVKEGELPEGWKWVKTGDVINTINNGYTPTKEFLSEGSGEIPFIKVYNLNFDGTLNFKKNPTYIPNAVHQKDLKRSICYPGDVLINIVGPPLGKVSVVTDQFPEWNINQAIVLFRPNEKVTSKFIVYLMQNSVTINWLENTSKATAGQWNVKVSTCREIPMPLPPLPEQHRIVSEIERRLSVCDKMEEVIGESLRQAEVIRQGVLKRAFEGRLV